MHQPPGGRSPHPPERPRRAVAPSGVERWPLLHEFIASETVGALVGSLGLIAAVPLTTAAAVFMVRRGGPLAERAGTIHHHH